MYPDPAGRPKMFVIPEGTTTVGSADDNDLVVADASVSPHHVVLTRSGERVELQDLFAGETLVNEQARRAGELHAGDLLRLGAVKLRVMRVATGKTGRVVTRQLAGALRADLAPGAAQRPAAAPAQVAAPVPAAPSSPPPAQAPARPGADTTLGGDASRTVGELDGAGRDTARLRLPQDEGARLARERDARRAKALARARQLSDEMMGEADFEQILERIAVGLLEVFGADRAVTLIFEEDGRNPLMTVEKRREGTDEGAGVAQEIIDRCLQVRSVIRVASVTGSGFAAPLITRGRALGLLYFERAQGPQQFEADDVHVIALLANQAALSLAPLLS